MNSNRAVDPTQRPPAEDRPSEEHAAPSASDRQTRRLGVGHALRNNGDRTQRRVYAFGPCSDRHQTDNASFPHRERPGTPPVSSTLPAKSQPGKFRFR